MKNSYTLSTLAILFFGSLFSLNLNAQTTLTISGPDEVCVGDVSTYSFSPSVSAASFNWTVSAEGTELSGGSTSVIQWGSTGNANITLQALDTAGTIVAQGSLNVTVSDIPQPSILPSTFVTCATADTLHIEQGFCIKACSGSEVTYAVEDLDGATYNWSVNGEESFTPAGNTCAVEWGDVGFGSVSVEVINGACTGTDQLCVEIIEKPQALFETMPEIIGQSIDVCKNSPILFFDESSAQSDSPLVSWVWDFGDGTTTSSGLGSAGNPVEHSYSESGTYQVTLTVTNACGCADRFEIQVNVSSYEGVQIECPRVLCEDEEVTYTVSGDSFCSQWDWQIDGGQIVSQNNQSATVLWDNVNESGFGYLTYNNNCQPCPGKTTVKIPVITDNVAIQGPTNVCPNSLVSYTMPQWPDVKFYWSVVGDATNISTEPNNVFTVQSGNSGSFSIRIKACFGLSKCWATDTLDVTISPQALIDGEQELCVDDSQEFTLIGATSATWTLTSPSGFATEYTDEANIEPTFAEIGTYTLEIEGEFCSPDLYLITVHAPPPPPNILGPDSACVGIPVQYTATPQISGATTQWGGLFGASVDPTVGSYTNATFTSFNAYIYATNILSNSAGCSSELSLLAVHALAPSSVTLSTDAPGDLTVCGSSQWTFDVDYTDGDLYQWEIDDPAMGSVVEGSNTPQVEILFNNPSGTAEDVDVIVAVTKCGEVLRDTLTMHVVNAPAYTATPGDTTICAGEALEFTVSPTPDGYSEFTWEFGDGSTSPDPNTTHAYPNNSSAAIFNPVATIVNPEGCLTTVVVPAGPVEVVPAPVALVSPVSTILGCGSFSETLSATVSTGFGSTTNYEWFGPTTSPGPPNCATCDTWTINQYDSDDPYYVVVENSYGCEAESNYVYAIENCESGCPDPKPFLVSSGSSFLDCAIAQANIQYDANGTTILSETWEFPDEASGTSFTTGTNATASGSFEEAGVYPFEYNVSYGDGTCTKLFVQDVYIPFVGDMRYSASCGTGSLYDITLFDHSNVFPDEEGSMVHIYEYFDGSTWQTITALPGALYVDIQLPAGNYDFREIIYSTLTTAAPPCTTVVSVNLPDKPDADFEINTPFEPACVNDVVVGFNNLSTPATGLVNLWDFGDGSTNYQQNPGKVYSDITPPTKDIALTVTNSIGCQDTAQGTIEIEDNQWWDGATNPLLSMSPSPPVCLGNPITLTYFNPDLSAQTPPNFTWYEGSTALTPVVSSSSFDVTLGGDYWVMGSDEYGCQVPSEQAYVYFTPNPTPTIIGNPNQCDSVAFTLTSSINTPGISLEWERSPGGVVGTGATLDQTLDEGTYTYTLTATQNGCDGVSVPYTVTVSAPVDPPSLSFDITSCDPYEVELTATNSQSGTYNWSNGSTGATATGNSGGLYEVYFTSDGGCTSSNEISVPYSPEEYLWNFPSGCFCKAEFVYPDSIEICDISSDPYMFGPTTSFASWSYQVNGVDVLSGTNSAPTGVFPYIEPDSVTLTLDNGYCEVISDAMYVSTECPDTVPQGIISNPDALLPDAEKDVFSQNNGALDPEITLVPNPAANQTRIHYRGNGSESPKTIEVYDMTGRKVRTLRLQNQAGSILLELGGFVGGIYQVCLRQEGRIAAHSKLSVTP